MSKPLAGLKAARLERGHSQQAAGDRIGVTKSHMGKIETGGARLDVHRAKVLADWLGVPMEALL